MNGLFKKFMQFAIGNGIVLVLGLISSLMITRIILKEEMGKFAMFTTVTSLIGLVVLVGADQAYIRYFNEEDEDVRGKLLKKAMKIPLIFNIVLGFILIVFYNPISEYISGEPSFALIVLILIHTIFSIISNFALVHVRMKQRAKMYSGLQIVNKITYLIVVCGLFYFLRNNYLVLVIATVAANIIMALMGIFVERKDWFTSSEKEVNTSLKEVLSYGVPFVFSMAIIWVFQSIDRMSLNSFCGPAEVGLYSGAMQIINLLNTVQAAFTTFWIPVAFERYSKAPEDKEFFIKINKIVSLVMLVLSIGLIATKDIIIYFLGIDYREAVFIFPFLVFMPIMYTISETTVLGINFNKKTKYHIYIAIISAVTNIIGNFMLVPKLGATGAAISTGIAYIVFFSARTYYSNKFYKINFQLKKFAVAIVLIYLFAVYSSFNKFNLIILIMAVGSTLVVAWLYKDIVKEGIELIKNYLNKRKQGSNDL